MSVPNLSMMRQRVTLTPFLRSDGFRQVEVYDDTASVVLRAKIEPATKLIRGQDGEQILANRRMWVHSPVRTIRTKDRITLPGGETPTIVTVSSISDTRGQTRVFELMLGEGRLG